MRLLMISWSKPTPIHAEAHEEHADVERLRLAVESDNQRANAAEDALSIERAAHAKTKAALLKWQMGEGDTEAEVRANRAEAVIVELRAWLLKLLCGENTARDAAIAADDLVVTRVRQGRINLIEDAADELDDLCRKHRVTLEEMK